MSDNKIMNTFLQELVDGIEEHHGEDVVVLDVAKQLAIADYALIVNSRNTIHAKALYEYIIAFLTERDVIPLNHRRNIDVDSGWCIVDCGNIVIHIMSKEKREFYQLERLWFDSSYVYGAPDLPITINDAKIEKEKM